MNKTSGLRYGNYYIYGYLDYDFYDSGKDGCTKLDKFSEKFQTAFDSPPPSFSENILQIFYNGYTCIYARRYEGQIV